MTCQTCKGPLPKGRKKFCKEACLRTSVSARYRVQNPEPITQIKTAVGVRNRMLAIADLLAKGYRIYQEVGGSGLLITREGGTPQMATVRTGKRTIGGHLIVTKPMLADELTIVVWPDDSIEYSGPLP